MPTITFRLSEAELDGLRRRADTEGKTLSEIVRDAVALAESAPIFTERFDAVERRLDRLEGMAGL